MDKEQSKQPVEASARFFETVDIAATDHAVEITNGASRSVLTQVAGEILKIDTPVQVGVTVTLPYAGWHHIAVTKVYKVGSTIADTVTLVSW